MVDQRRDKRAPASLKVKYKSANVDQFIQQFGTDVSRGGMFIKTKTPLEMGTLLKLELQLSDASPVIQGMGRVCWRRVTSTDASFPAGMGLKFVRLEDSSRTTIERIVQQRGGAPSRFDQTAGAEVSNEPDDVEPSMPAPAASAAPRPASPAAAAAPVRAAAAKPAATPAASPRAAAPRPAVAGLFAKSAIASQPPEPPPEGGARSSFFPPAPSAERPGAPRAAGPAGAFGAAKAAAAAPTPAIPARPADDEEAAFDRLFDEVQRGKSSAPPANAPAAPRPAAARAASMPAPAPAAAAPVTEMDDVFGALGEEEGLRSLPPPKPARSSAPDSAAEALAALAAPERASSAGRTSSPGLSIPMGDDGDFGEADIGGGVSAPPPPAASLHPLAAVQNVAAAPAAKRSVLPWVLALLLVVGAGGAYLYYQRMLAEQAARTAELEREAIAAAEPPTVAEALSGAGAGMAGAAAAPAVAAPSELTTPAIPIQVEVTSVPRGADLVVGDDRVGMTPMRVELPIGRPAIVSVRSPGFATETRTVTATPNQEPLRFKLEPLAYVLFVRTEPAEAELEIGAQKVVAPGPLELGHLDGGIVVSVSKPGHQRMTRPVRLEEFNERDGKMRGEIDVRLSPLPGFKEPAAPKPPAAKPRPRPPARKPAASVVPAPAAEGEPAAAPAPAPAAPAPPPAPAVPSAP